MDARGKIFLALDGLSARQALQLTREACESSLWRIIAGVKIHSLFDQEGPSIIPRLRKAGAPVILVDMKIHDTPGAAALRAAALKDVGADVITTHASGGVEMMRAVVERGPFVLGVTILTSLSRADVRRIYRMPLANAVLLLARDAQEAGIREIVCSPDYVVDLAHTEDLRSLCFVTPNIRLFDRYADDVGEQMRENTPYRAFRNGATHIVLGSEYTDPTDTESRLAVLKQIVEQIESVPR